MKAKSWYSTPQAARHRKGVLLTLSDDERERLDELSAQRNQPKSRIVGELIMAVEVEP